MHTGSAVRAATMIVLHYTNDHRAFAAQSAFLARGQRDRLRRDYYRLLVRNLLLMAAGAYCAFKAQSFPLLAVFCVYLLFQLLQARPFSVIERRAQEAGATRYAVRTLRLEVLEDGLQETVEDIVSFVPWKRVAGFGIFQDVLLIQLAAGLWSLVPCHGLLADSASIDELMEELRRRGVTEWGPRPGT